MAAALANVEGLPISKSVIESRMTAGLGVQSVIADGFVDPHQAAVGITMSISADGTEISEHSFWWTGQQITFAIQANAIWPTYEADVKMVIMCVPQDQFFYPNATATQWLNGMDAIGRDVITVQGGAADVITEIKSREWIYRMALTTTNNVRQSRIVMHVLPISMATLNSLTDGEGPDLCIIPFPFVSAPWSTSPDPSMRFFGPLPIFRDRRCNEARSAGVLPSSQLIKKYVRRAFLSCSANPQISAPEIQELLDDPQKHPPSRPASIGVWPEVPPDSATPPSSQSGVSISQAAQMNAG